MLRTEVPPAVFAKAPFLSLVLVVSAFSTVVADEREIASRARALLSDKCFACHGPDASSRAAGLRLDQREHHLAPSTNDPERVIVVAGDLGASELWQRVSSEDDAMRMPPPESTRPLSDADRALLKQWIAAGAPWTDHWAFVPPQRATTHESSDATSIDRFVAAKLADRGRTFAAEANRSELIRRLTIDLTGLPPTPEEIVAFTTDDSSLALETVVDRLLASPRFGERMASDWLDLARYADTYGYQNDKFRRVWPYRDWVVRAFNENLPYSEFLTWQIAGDLLPAATRDQVLATNFNRLHRQTNEGGSVPEEFRTAGVADRTNTFAASMLGLTMECARCHDHKFDPIPQRDYYRLFAFFNNIDELGLYSHFTEACPPPTLWLPSKSQEAALARLNQRVKENEAKLQRAIATSAAEFDAWYDDWQSREFEPLEPLAAYTFDKPDDALATVGQPETVVGKHGRSLALDGENGVETKVPLAFDQHDKFTIALWIKPGEVADRAVVLHRSKAWLDAAGRGYQLVLRDGCPEAALVHFWPGNAIAVGAEQPLRVDEWSHVTITYDGSSQASGLVIYVNGQRVETETLADSLDRTVRYSPSDTDIRLQVGYRFRDNGFRNGQVDELTIFDAELTSVEVARLAGVDQPGDEASGHEYFLHRQFAEYQTAAQQLYDARRERNALVDNIPEIMTMEEMPTRRTTHLLERGEYDLLGDAVEPGLPSHIGKEITLERPDRLGLAQWLTDRRHPLTARVAVNRIWYLFMGRGLVHPIDNFGSQGSRPTHPELLDSLALDFIKSGWDVKALCKRIVMSQTYRQSSAASSEVWEIDPENQWLTRGPRRRLSAEPLRDGALYASGQLVEQLGGPPVKPFQPAGLWEEKGGESYRRDVGPGSHRRSIYTFWKLTSPPPNMMTLDAADREICVVQRQQTATPLQAFVLLNDPQFVEASVALADRSQREFPQSPRDQIESVVLRLLNREASAAELDLMTDLYAQQLSHFAAHPKKAEQLLTIGDFRTAGDVPPETTAALAVVASAILNHHTFVHN